MKTKKKIIIFGAGYHGRNVLRKCNQKKSSYKVICFIDNDKKKRKILDLKVIHPSKILKLTFDKIIFCGRNIKDQVKQIKKIGINKSKFIFWGWTKLKLSKQDLNKRSKILTRMLKYVTYQFKKNNIIYWVDFSGLLALMRKQDLAEMSDVDISVYHKDLKKILKILKKNSTYFKFYSKPIFNKYKVLNYRFHITGNINNKKIEPPGIGLHVNKINRKFLEKNTMIKKTPYNLLKSTKKHSYKGLDLTIPEKSEKYLNIIYGKNWKKKTEFYSIKN